MKPIANNKKTITKKSTIYLTPSVKKSTNAATMTNNTTQKDSVIIVIINMVELKNLGIVLIRNYMLQECVKIVTLITIIRKNG